MIVGALTDSDGARPVSRLDVTAAADGLLILVVEIVFSVAANPELIGMDDPDDEEGIFDPMFEVELLCSPADRRRMSGCISYQKKQSAR